MKSTRGLWAPGRVGGGAGEDDDEDSSEWEEASSLDADEDGPPDQDLVALAAAAVEARDDSGGLAQVRVLNRRHALHGSSCTAAVLREVAPGEARGLGHTAEAGVTDMARGKEACARWIAWGISLYEVVTLTSFHAGS